MYKMFYANFLQYKKFRAHAIKLYLFYINVNKKHQFQGYACQVQTQYTANSLYFINY